jgi:hypothetical protein
MDIGGLRSYDRNVEGIVEETWNAVKPELMSGMSVQESQMAFHFRTRRL